MIRVTDSATITVAEGGSCNAVRNVPLTDVFVPCVAVSVTNIPDTNAAPSVIDFVPLQAGDRVLLAGQTNTVENGIYVVQSLSPTVVLLRAPDLSVGDTVPSGNIVSVLNGLVYGFTTYTVVSDGTVGTDPILIPRVSPVGLTTAIDVSPFNRAVTLNTSELDNAFVSQTLSTIQGIVSTLDVQNTSDVDLVTRTGGALLTDGGMRVELNALIGGDVQSDGTLFLPSLVPNQVLVMSGDTVSGVADLTFDGTVLNVASSVTADDVQANVLPFIGANQVLFRSPAEGAANLTWDGSVLTVTGDVSVSTAEVTGALAYLSADQVAFGGPAAVEGDAGFLFDGTTMTFGGDTFLLESPRIQFTEPAVMAPPAIGSVSTGTQVLLDVSALAAGQTYASVGRESTGTLWFAVGDETDTLTVYSGNTSTLALDEYARIGNETLFTEQVRPLGSEFRVQRVTDTEYLEFDGSGGGILQSETDLTFAGGGSTIALQGFGMLFDASAATDSYLFQCSNRSFALPQAPQGAGDTLELLSANDEVVTDTSLRRLKGNVRCIRDVLAPRQIFALTPVAFEWASSGQTSFGFVAEDAANVSPVLVTRDRDGRPKGVRYKHLSAALVKEAQEMWTDLERFRSNDGHPGTYASARSGGR